MSLFFLLVVPWIFFPSAAVLSKGTPLATLVIKLSPDIGYLEYVSVCMLVSAPALVFMVTFEDSFIFANAVFHFKISFAREFQLSKSMEMAAITL